MKAFQIGDRIRVIQNRVESNPIIGRTGTIVNQTCHPTPMWAVQFDDEPPQPEGIGTLMNGCEIEKLNDLSVNK
ncbi:MAG: hypothetical protein KME10_19115 [Plectolyngbya sp. WJT66-NPBG17]|jgi:hypothetical protein|nr:hypothetical protein [Plectolyngbya sp. WJT66-NPBG17]